MPLTVWVHHSDKPIPLPPVYLQQDYGTDGWAICGFKKLAAAPQSPYLDGPNICVDCSAVLAVAKTDESHWLNPKRIEREDLEALEAGWISEGAYRHKKRLLEDALREAGDNGHTL